MAGKKKTTAPKTARKQKVTGAGTGIVMIEGDHLPTSQELTKAMFPAAPPSGAEAPSGLFGPPPPVGKKKEVEIPDRAIEIQNAIKLVNASYKGRVILRQGSEINNVFLLRRPTGITTLDLRIAGGLPAGGVTQIIGKYSAGKTWLANRIMSVAQQNYGNDFAAFIAMTEMRYDKGYAKTKCGVRIAYSEDEIALLRRIQLEKGLPDFTPEQYTWMRDQVGTLVEGVAATAEGILEIAVQMVEANCYQIVLIDSFGALLTKAESEAEEGLEQKYRGGAATVVTQFMHRLHAALNLPDKYGRPNTTTIIGINQYRDNINAGTYGNPMKVAGGHALAHGKLVDIHVEQGAKIRVPISSRENLVVGKEINWEILKAKAGSHDGPKGTFKFYLGEGGYPFGVDLYADLLSAGLQTEAIQQSGAWYYFNGNSIGQGADAVAQTLYKNPELMNEIRHEIFKSADLSFIVKET